MIARNVNTHPSRLRKVMSCLRKQGFVATKEGIGGGFYLNRSPETATLAELYTATSIGSLKPSWCSGNEDEGCMIACNMTDVMNDIFGEAEQQLLLHLQHMTISDVLGRVKETQKQKQ